MPNEKLPCPHCGSMIWVYYPNGTILKSAEQEDRSLFFDTHMDKSRSHCPDCGGKFYVFFYLKK